MHFMMQGRRYLASVGSGEWTRRLGSDSFGLTPYRLGDVPHRLGELGQDAGIRKHR